MTPETIKQAIRECQTLSQLEATAGTHRAAMKRLDADPETAPLAIQIRNLFRLRKADLLRGE